MKWQTITQKRAQRKLPEEFFAGRLADDLPMNHAKLLATDKAMMDGSHNYHPLGVKLGTAEIALHHRDPEFARHAASNLLQLLGCADWPQFSHLM